MEGERAWEGQMHEDDYNSLILPLILLFFFFFIDISPPFPAELSSHWKQNNTKLKIKTKYIKINGEKIKNTKKNLFKEEENCLYQKSRTEEKHLGSK